MLCLAELFFLTSSNMSQGAKVEALVNIGGVTVPNLPDLVQFSLFGSIHDMANASTWILVVGVAGFSGIWPYIKLFCMIYIWFAPHTWLGSRWRGRLLEMLEYTGKWGLISFFCMVLNVSAFHMHIDSSTITNFPVPDNAPWQLKLVKQVLSTLPAHWAIIDVGVVFCFGITTLIFCVGFSHVINHLMLHYHRRAAAYEHDPNDARSAAVYNLEGKWMQLEK